MWAERKYRSTAKENPGSGTAAHPLHLEWDESGDVRVKALRKWGCLIQTFLSFLFCWLPADGWVTPGDGGATQREGLGSLNHCLERATTE